MAARPEDLDVFLDDDEAPDWAGEAAAAEWTPEAAPPVLSDTEVGPSPSSWKPKWLITDDSVAAWAMRKVARAQAEVSEVDRIAQERVERIMTWRERAAKPFQREIDFFVPLLERYGEESRQANDKRATIPLPDGDIKTTKRKAAAAFGDETLVLAWAKEGHPDLVHEKEWVLVSEARSVVKIGARAIWACETCGPHPDSRPDWCGAGCGSDSIGMSRLEMPVVVDTTTGEPAPGWSIEPEKVTAKVVPRPRGD